MEKIQVFHLILVFLTLILYSHGGDAKGEVDMDILTKLKDSGALDNIQEELEKMLKTKEATEGDVPIAQAYAHIQKFVKERNYKLTDALMKGLVRMRSVSESQFAHFNVLDEIAYGIDKILSKGPSNDNNDKLVSEATDKLTELIDKFQNIEEFRDMLRSQRKVHDEATGQRKKEDKTDTEETEANPSSFMEGLSVDDMIQGADMFFGMIKTNPDMIIDIVGNYVEQQDLLSKKTTKMVANYAKNFAKTDYFTSGADYFATGFTQTINTPGGRKMLEMIPTLMEADSQDTITEIVKSQTEAQWENFFNAINNSDLRDAFLLKVSTYVEYIYSGILMDDMKMMMANAFLLTQNLPPISPRRLMPSIVDLVSKCIKLFTAMDIDMTLYENMSKELANNFATEYVNSNEFAKLKQNERIRLITRFFEENVVISAMELWKAHQHIFGKAMPISHAFDAEGKTPRDITRNLHCAENLLCAINSHSRKKASLIRKTTSKGLSLAMAWLWGNTGLNLQTWKLYAALNNGADILKGVDCDESYPVSSKEKSCKIFEWQADKMSLSFDDKELPKAAKPVEAQKEGKPSAHEEL
jgi:hypothetical protein